MYTVNTSFFFCVHTLLLYKFVVGKALESCYPESSSSYDCKSDYIKRDLEQHTTKNRTLKIKKKTSARNSRKLKTKRTRKLLSNKKVSKNAATKVSESTLQILIINLNPHFFNCSTLEL